LCWPARRPARSSGSIGIAALTLTGLFVLSVTRLLRAFKGRS
jgi:hypothetical protein